MGSRRTVGAIIGEAFGYYKRSFLLFFVISLIVYGISDCLGKLSTFIMTPLGLDAESIRAIISAELAKGFGSNVRIVLVMVFILLVFCFAFVLSMMLANLFAIPHKALTVSAYDFTLRLHGGGKARIREVVLNFARNWRRFLGISAWSSLWIWLWSLLLFIPGLVKSLSYMFAPFLILKYPELTIRQALRKSIEITNGYKWRLFWLGLCVDLPMIVVMVVLTIFLFSGHRATYDLLMRIINPIYSVLLTEPLGYMMYTIVYLDIKQAAIEKGLLPGEAGCGLAESGRG